MHMISSHTFSVVLAGQMIVFGYWYWYCMIVFRIALNTQLHPIYTHLTSLNTPKWCFLKIPIITVFQTCPVPLFIWWKYVIITAKPIYRNQKRLEKSIGSEESLTDEDDDPSSWSAPSTKKRQKKTRGKAVTIELPASLIVNRLKR